MILACANVPTTNNIQSQAPNRKRLLLKAVRTGKRVAMIPCEVWRGTPLDLSGECSTGCSPLRPTPPGYSLPNGWLAPPTCAVAATAIPDGQDQSPRPKSACLTLITDGGANQDAHIKSDPLSSQSTGNLFCVFLKYFHGASPIHTDGNVVPPEL